MYWVIGEFAAAQGCRPTDTVASVAARAIRGANSFAAPSPAAVVNNVRRDIPEFRLVIFVSSMLG
jgi:hypothetical protein